MNAPFARWFVALPLLLVAVTCIHAQRPELVVQTGHTAQVRVVAFSPNGKIIASAGLDNTVILWDVVTGRQLRSLAGHTGSISSLSFDRDGTTLASGGQDYTIRLWNVQTGAELRTITPRSLGVVTSAVSFTSDGQALVSFGSEITFWNPSSGNRMRTIPLPDGRVDAFALAPDGETLAGAGREDKKLILRNLTTGAVIRTFDKLPSAATHLAFNRDGTLLAAGTEHDSTFIWETGSGQLKHTFSKSVRRDDSVAFSPDGKSFVTGGSRAFSIWDLATETETRKLTFQMPRTEDLAFFNTLAISPDGQTIAGGGELTAWPDTRSGGLVVLWEAATGNEVHTLAGNTAASTGVAFSHDGRQLAHLDANGNAQLWDLPRGLLRRAFRAGKASSCLAFSPDDQLLAISGYGHGKGDYKISLWNNATGLLYRALAGHQDGVSAVAFSADGRLLVSSGVLDRSIKLWNVETGALVKSIPVQIKQILFSVSISPDGQTIAFREDGATIPDSFGKYETFLSFFDVRTGKSTRVPARAITSSSFSPDGAVLATGNGDGSIQLWDVARRAESRTLAAPAAKRGLVRALAFSRDGKWLAGDNGPDVIVWDAATGSRLRTLSGHDRNLTGLSFLGGTPLLASSSADATVKLWNSASGEELATLVTLDEVDWLVLTPDGLFDGKPAAWSKVLWRFGGDTFSAAPAELYFKEYFAPGLLSEIVATGTRPHPPVEISHADRRQPTVKLVLEGQPGAIKDRASRSLAVTVEVREAPADGELRSGGGVRDVRLFRNGSLVKVWRGDLPVNENGVVILRTSVPAVGGENELTAYAFNHDDVKSADARLTFTGPAFLTRRGVAYVVAIGINKYANAEFNLQFATPDAQSFGAEVRTHFLASGLYERVEVATFTDAQATKKSILAALDRLSGAGAGTPDSDGPDLLPHLPPVPTVQPEDAIIIYFAGHGIAYDNRFYLVTHDLGYQGPRVKLDEAGVRTIIAHGVSDEELQQSLERIDAGQMLLVVDACNSGQALEAQEERRGPMNSRGLAQLAYEKGMYILTAAQSYQSALEDSKLGHGYLTYSLIEEGLKTKKADQEPADGIVTAQEWMDYASARVPAMQDASAQAKRLLVQQAAGPGGPPPARPASAVQQPRLFYRREHDDRSWIVSAAVAATGKDAILQFSGNGVSFDYVGGWIAQSRTQDSTLSITLTQPGTGAIIELSFVRGPDAERGGLALRLDAYLREVESQGGQVVTRFSPRTFLLGERVISSAGARVARGENVELRDLLYFSEGGRNIYITITGSEKTVEASATNLATILKALKIL